MLENFLFLPFFSPSYLACLTGRTYTPEIIRNRYHVKSNVEDLYKKNY